MKKIKKLLNLCFAVILLGIFSQSIYYIPKIKVFMALAMLLVVVFGIVYAVLAVVKKTDRVNGFILLSSSPMVLALLFENMHWKHYDLIHIVSTPVFLTCALFLFIYRFRKKEFRFNASLFLALSILNITFLFKSLDWPMYNDLVLYIPLSLVLILVGYNLVKLKSKMKLDNMILISILALGFTFCIQKESSIFRFLYISLTHDHIPITSPKVFHYHAWTLYQEGQSQEAKNSIKKGIISLDNYRYYIHDKTKESFKLEFEKTLEMIDLNTWKSMNLRGVQLDVLSNYHFKEKRKKKNEIQSNLPQKLRDFDIK